MLMKHFQSCTMRIYHWPIWRQIQQEVCRPFPRILMMQITRLWTAIMHWKCIWKNKSGFYVLPSEFSNKTFVKSKFWFVLIVEEKHTVWYNIIDLKYKNEKKCYTFKIQENHKFCITKREYIWQYHTMNYGSY